MKREVISFKVQAPKPRRHQELFDNDLPFRGRREEPKTVYKRKQKHKNKGEW